MDIYEKQYIHRRIDGLQGVVNCLKGVTPSVTIVFIPKEIKEIAINLIEDKIKEYQEELNPFLKYEKLNTAKKEDVVKVDRPIKYNLMDIQEVIKDLHERVKLLEMYNNVQRTKEHLDYIKKTINKIDMTEYKIDRK